MTFPPGPWRWELSRHSKRIELCGGPRFDHTVLSFARYGMGGAAPVFWSWSDNLGNPQRADELAIAVEGREHHADWFANVNHPVAHVLAAAAELYEELEALVARCDGPEGVRADGSNVETLRAHAALAKARGE